MRPLSHTVVPLIFGFSSALLPAAPLHAAKARTPKTASAAVKIAPPLPPIPLLRVRIPGSLLNATGRLDAELLGDGAQALAALQALSPVRGGWTLSFKPAVPLAAPQLRWLRLKLTPWQGVHRGEAQIRPLSDFTPQPALRLIGAPEWMPGERASLRILVSDQRDHTPLGEGRVKMRMVFLNDKKEEAVEAGAAVDETGVAVPAFVVPVHWRGDLALTISYENPQATGSAQTLITVLSRRRVLFSADRPLYQPGHLVHLRLLAFARRTRHAVKDQPVLIEVEDGRGNRVFQQSARTNAFGVAAADFQLADEVNLGEFHARASVGAPGGRDTASAETSFTVDRYLLPRFRIQFHFDGAKESARAEGAPRRFYLPGDLISGTVEAKYLFGEPLAGARVALRIAGLNDAAGEKLRQEIHLDAGGNGKFSIALPALVKGQQPPSPTPIALSAAVEDAAGHGETRDEPLLLAGEPILITALAEGGGRVNGVSNRVLIRTTDPAGQPLITRLSGEFPGLIETDGAGFATLDWPVERGNQVVLSAQDASGHHGTLNFNLSARNDSGGLLLHAVKVIVMPGEPVALTLYSDHEAGPVFVDLLKDGQPILMTTADFTNGAAQISLQPPPELRGLVAVRVWRLDASGQPRSDRRLIYIDPAGDLTVRAQLQRASYHPGENAELHIAVRDGAGRPAPAALEVKAVDEAVYQLVRKWPGGAGVFLHLERELIAGRSLKPALVSDDLGDESLSPAQREMAARLLFAAAENILQPGLDVGSLSWGRVQDGSRDDEQRGGYSRLGLDHLTAVANGLNHYLAGGGALESSLDDTIAAAIRAGLIAPEWVDDPLGRALVFKKIAGGSHPTYSVSWQLPAGGTSELYLRATLNGHDGVPAPELRVEAAAPDYPKPGPRRGIELRGTILDVDQWPVADARVRVVNAAGKIVSTLLASAEGAFVVTGLPHGRYIVEITADGMRSERIFTEEVNTGGVVDLTPVLNPASAKITFTAEEKAMLPSAPAAVQKIAPPAPRVAVQSLATQAELREFAGRFCMSQANGCLIGRVTDDKGAPLPGAVVKAKLRSRPTKGAECDAKGIYGVQELISGQYEVTVSMDGFGTQVVSAVSITAGQRTLLSFKLSEGSEVIKVTASAIHIDTTSTTATTSINLTDAIQEFAQSNALAAAFDFSPGANGVGRGKVSISGASGTENQYLIGGVNITNAGYGGLGAYETRLTSPGESPAPRERRWFPESLYYNPLLLTDEKGEATVNIPLADSITTWRLALLASTENGDIATTETGLKVFQDFFMDLDLPLSLTRGDVVTVPVAVYNYRDHAADFSVVLKAGQGFELVDDAAQKPLFLKANEAGAVKFRIRATGLGRITLRVSGQPLHEPDAVGDALAREIEVISEGRETLAVVNGRLEKAAALTLETPADTLPGASRAWLTIFPSAMSQTVAGLDSILQMPSGCFEQTSSTTYPNLLVLDYLQRSKTLSPEIRAKAENFVALGYQRLVTFEVPGGGFSWFGRAPAHQILTGYGLMEFTDMAKVHPVDPRLIARTRQWLISQQQPDGGWQPDHFGYTHDAAAQLTSDRLRITGYLAWSLTHAGESGPALMRAHGFIETHFTGNEDAYTLAILANLADEAKWNDALGGKIRTALIAAAKPEGKGVHWSLTGATPTYATGDSAGLEATGLAAQALLLRDAGDPLALRALDYLLAHKDARGNWQTTQATIHALRALILAKNGTPAEGILIVNRDGHELLRQAITIGNRDMPQVISLSAPAAGEHTLLTLNWQGKGRVDYQLTAQHYLPWESVDPSDEPLALHVRFDHRLVKREEAVTAKLILRNNRETPAAMVMVEMGIPPGFDPEPQAFEDAISADDEGLGHLTKVTRAGQKMIFYFDGLAPLQSVSISGRLRARFSGRTQTPPSRIYEYYNPDIEAYTPPIGFTVTE